MSTVNGGWELPISEGELSRMTRDLDQAHREYLPSMYAAADDLSEQLRDSGAVTQAQEEQQRVASRRRFLIGAGGAAAALALAACSSSKSTKASAAPGSTTGAASSGTSNTTPSPSTSSSGAGVYTGDLKVVALATALENQAVGAYTAALAAAKAGKLGTVPPAVGTFATTAMSQHADHAKAWNAVLTGAKVPAITGVPLSNQAATLSALGAVTDVGGVAKLALRLEDQAAQTYLFAAANVTSPGGIATAASIAPVEAMHAAILNFVIGQYPVPDDFLGTSLAASPTLLTV
ncbi:ferritin-like domain-containing protein [Catenulispora sp. NF23]|uniref:ferritin-like domain-containing protein n=1 Tax=Catenulispora pinistramenti TaxID=2705254 RepID=UPI001BAD4263|nr:ferritin-like domain-containing protein [Catenulispora pinistramenti]MBS2533563.1 ferritin-like domain-containing protein [Catenulispora pinistramenti]